MDYRTTLSLNSFWEWLDWVEQFPFVPRWRWTSKSWNLFSRKLFEADISHCRDDHGNVLLGATTSQEWFAKIQRAETKLLLQAHLDHPGAVALHALETGNDCQRYSALVQGALHHDLVGRRFQVYDQDGSFAEEVLIDAQTEGFKEPVVTFQAKNKIILPAYLRGPHQNNQRIFEEGFLEGWGLDNHIGSAALLAYFSQKMNENILGLLTLDEEIGNLGLLAHLQEAEGFGVTAGNTPLFLSIEVTPEYPELEFICGGGPRWRSADKNGELTHFLENPIALKGGSCEAGQWTRLGGRSACLVIPSQYAHNGLREKEWRAERVAVADVALLQKKFEEGIEYWRKKNRGQPLNGAHPSPAKCNDSADCKIVAHDHLLALREAAQQSPGYLECLQKVLPPWNELHARFDLPAMRFPEEDWEAFRKQLLDSELWAERISENAKKCFLEVREFLALKRNDLQELPIHLFVGAPFNASNQHYGIALSAEKIKESDLRRILIHEMTHWIIAPALRSLNFPPLVKAVLNEGLACKTTIDLLEISPAQALGMSEEEYLRYEKNESLLDSYFQQWLHGDLFTLRKGRHEIVEPKKLPHPFLISKGGDFPKYGYFIGLKAAGENRRQL